jgi:signal transduction histidine kinase
MDELVALVLLIEMGLQTWLSPYVGNRLPTAVGAAVLSLGVAVRRRWPLAALVVVGVVLPTTEAVGGRVTQHTVGALVALVLLFYGVGAFLPERRGRWALGLVLVVGAIHGLIIGSAFSDLGFAAIVLELLPWAMGRTLRQRDARARAYREAAERLDAGRELRARTAIYGERARIARELHDVIAHSVSVMVIQAAGARTVMDRDPVRAESALRSVERAGREALAEMRRLLGVLADGQDLRALAPQPGLEDLPELVSSTRAAGLNASIRVDGDPVAVTQGLSLCAYRVVQEALMNTLKHAGPTQAEVYLRWCEDALELRVSDTGRVAARGVGEPVAGSSGHGIAGMRERAALHGGSVQAGSAPDGGFVVRATIPLIAGSVT